MLAVSIQEDRVKYVKRRPFSYDVRRLRKSDLLEKYDGKNAHLSDKRKLMRSKAPGTGTQLKEANIMVGWAANNRQGIDMLLITLGDSVWDCEI